MSQIKRKPKKPYAGFPLTAHRNGQWVKKIRGRIRYFGTDANSALEQYLNERDDLQAGREPRTTTGVTLRDLINQYLTVAKHRQQAGDLSPLSLRDYVWTGKQLLDHFGKTIDPEQIRPVEGCVLGNVN